MNDTKAWYTSRGTWGGLFAALVPIAGIFLHVNVTDAQVQEAATDFALVGGAVAGLIALVGRIRATKIITLKGQ